jgi:UPF0042 nucleotide-binding protein
MQLIIISGRSGSGKTITLNLLEDLGYYCIDNLPLSLLPELADKLKNHYQKVAISIDARNLQDKLRQFDQIFTSVKKTCDDCQVIFLDAADDSLLKRFSETRRKHPLTNETTSLESALNTEHQLLQPIIEYADLSIDTSTLSIQELREYVRNCIHQQNTSILLLFQSFGYKFGVPNDSNFIFDSRCLPNPYWQEKLRHLTGLNQEVIDYLEQFKQTHTMYKMIKKYLAEWLPDFAIENRRYLTVSIGCTGGQHRSVYLTEKLKNYFLNEERNVFIRHRDLL